MVKQYFTSMEISKDGYVGSVYTASTNIPVFRTAPHPSQQLAQKEITDYLKHNTATSNRVDTQHPVTPGEPQFKRRCCGG